MKKSLKFANLFILAPSLIISSCSDDDKVEITLEDLTVTIDENPTNGQVLGAIQSNSNSALTYSITSQTPNGALNINGSTGELTVADAILFDFETNTTITAVVAAPEAQNTATVTINIDNVNELSVQDFTATIDENPTDGQVLGAIQATGDGTLSFSITSQTPTGAINIDAATGELTVSDPNLFDFETNPVITADILVDNSGNTETVMATITLNDLDEVSAQNLNVAIDENPINGQVVGTIPATGGNLVYSITFQNPAGAFNINANTGELTVADATLFDFETNPNMLATVSVENTVNMVSVNANLSVNDVNEIGEFKYGGVIFWIDPASNNSEGLVISLYNQAGGVPWGCLGVSTGATGTAIGTGETNTNAIMNSTCASGSAAEIAANLNENGFDDWFLPSMDEWSEFYSNVSILGNAILANGGDVISNSYWSSTEVDSNNAIWYNVTQSINIPKDATFLGVRAVRAWTDF